MIIKHRLIVKDDDVKSVATSNVYINLMRETLFQLFEYLRLGYRLYK